MRHSWRILAEPLSFWKVNRDEGNPRHLWQHLLLVNYKCKLCSGILLVMIAVIAFCWRWRWGGGGGLLLHLSCSWYKCVSGGQYGCSGPRWSDTKLCIWESQSWWRGWRRHVERSPIHVDPLPLPHPDHLGHSLHHSSRSAPDTPAILAMHFYLKQDIVFTDQELFSV